MSLHDTLIYGMKTLWVNAVEQYDKSAIEFAGPGVSVAVANNRNVVTIASSIAYAVGVAGGTVPAGGTVVMRPSPDSISAWVSGAVVHGIAVNSGDVGDQISVQSYGLTPAINHALWVAKPTSADVGDPVYAATLHKYTMTPSTTPGQYNQKIGTLWFADIGLDTTTVLLNIQPPVIVPAM